MADEVGRLNALVLKLRHPLAKIQSRALRSLLFKLRERLVHWQELEALHTSLVSGLLACLEAPLELETLHVLQLLVESQSNVLLASLQRAGVAQKLQRGANTSPELQLTYEKLLRQIYATKFVVQEETIEKETKPLEDREAQRLEDVAAWKRPLARRTGRKVDKVEAQGWKFAHVALTSTDEQLLFAFEVKLELRTATSDIVAACATFRNDFLRNFPAEVFLERPATLEHLLRLVQAPILVERRREEEEEEGAIIRMLHVSMGINYFDEVGNSTFNGKQSNLATAVIMASLKAIESLLYALQRTRRLCLDPTYTVHAVNEHMELIDDCYDTRRVLYPRARVEKNHKTSLQSRSDGLLEQFSLSGAMYRIFVSILPLLRSVRHPRLHLLNLLVVALPYLVDKGEATSAQAQKLNKLRLERIFELLSGICRPASPEQGGNNIMDDDLELTHSMTWKLVELVLKLLRLCPSSCYRVEKTTASKHDDGSETADAQSEGIIIPRLLWDAVKVWIASPVFPEVSSKEWKDAALIQFLTQIDGTIPAFINLKHSSVHDAKAIVKFVEFAKVHHEQFVRFGPWEKPATMTLEIARKTVQARDVFDGPDTEIIADAVLQTIWSALLEGASDNAISESHFDAIQCILSDMLSELGEKKTLRSQDSMSFHFFRGFVDLMQELVNGTNRVAAPCQLEFLTDVVGEAKFLALLLLVLAQDDGNGTIFWEILRIALTQLVGCSVEKLALLEPVVPLLQHFAYLEPSVKSSREQRSTQPQLAEILNRVETVVPDHSRRLLICRCLLHESSYIRKAASCGVLRLLTQANSLYVERIAKDKAVREDPFGWTTVGNGNTRSFEVVLMETPLPNLHANGHPPSENELSSQLRRLSHLCKVLSGTSCAFESMREAALKELILMIEHSSAELITLFEEMDALTRLVDLVGSFLRVEKPQQHDSSMLQQALILLRALLLRSRLLRSAIQRDSDTMNHLMASIFHNSVSIRAQMYYILLLLTCSAENFVPHGELSSEDRHSNEARIPEMIKTTFGLYSRRWTHCLVVTCSLKQHLQTSCALIARQRDPSWLQEVKGLLNQTPVSSDDDGLKHDEKSTELSELLGAEYAVIAQKLRTAPSHGKCLNALYHLMTMCQAWHIGREHFVSEWETDFERYLAVPPQSERDEVIVGSLVAALSVMFSAMTRKEQLHTLVIVKRKVLPLLKKSQSKIFSMQVARLLLTVSKSKVKDLFVSLAADTDIIATICTKYSAMYATESVLHGLMLEVLLQFAKGLDEKADAHLSSASRAKICKRLLEMLSPLLTVVCRHRVPGSFLDRNVFVLGSQCLTSILQVLPRDSLRTNACPLEHTDRSILIDGNWASRFLFDHVSPMRELGFLVVEYTASLNSPSTRLLQMALETSIDNIEADAVRAAACTALIKEILRYHERSLDQQAAVREALHGLDFATMMLRSFLHSLKAHTLRIRTLSAFARLVRVLYVRRDSLALHFGDMHKALQAAEEEDEVYPLLVQTLSLRGWKDKCDRYCSCWMLLPRCDDDLWRRSLLPAIVDLMAEVLNLLQVICHVAGAAQVAYFLMHTTLRFQLVELVQDIYESFEAACSIATKQKQYEVLDLCAGTLGILLIQVFEQHSQHDKQQLEAPTTPSFGTQIVDVVAKLLGPHHPIDFRVSFARIVPSLSIMISGSLKSPDPSKLSPMVLALYQQVTEVRPLDATILAAPMPPLQGRVFPLTAIHRVTCALQLLLGATPNLHQLVRVECALSFALTSIKELFAAIRIAGGFGGKREKNCNTTANTHNVYVLDLCGRIQAHIEVMSALIGGDGKSQQLAKDEGLLGVLLSNWSVITMAHVRGSHLMLRTLHLLANYIYGNDTTRKSMLMSLQSKSPNVSASEGAPTLLSHLFDLASSRGDVTSSLRQVASGTFASSSADVALSNAACQVLKGVLLSAECVLASLKIGSISRLIDSLQDRLKKERKRTSKTDRLEAANLAHMLGVFSSVASSEEGARVLYTNWSTVLSLVFDDVMHSSDEIIQRSGCLMMRNLALSQATKNHFAVWEELLDAMIALCVRVSSTTRVDLIVLGHVSAALWSLVYDNQKARALLLAKPTALQTLQQILSSLNAGAFASTSSQEVTENLQRVLMLIKE